MDRVRARVTRTVGDRRGLDDLDYSWILGVRLCVDHVNTRRAQARDNQIPAFDMRVRHIRAQARAASVPTEMVQLVSDPGHFKATNDLPVSQRSTLEIHNGQLVVASTCGIESYD
jgi:hypothetical protein